MRALWISLMFAGLVLAGCASDSPEGEAQVDGQFDDVRVEVDDENGAILGVVVDSGVVPVEGVTVNLTSVEPPRQATSDAQGRFVFSKVPAGVHLLEASKLNFRSTQFSTQVEAGIADPGVVRVQLERLFSQEPYKTTEQFAGFIQCGWAVSGVGSSLCANDYTRFIPIVGNDPKCPQCEHLLGDNRGHDFVIGPGWQTAIFEMTWEPSAQGTSPEMKLIVSHTPRPATHWYAAHASPDPLLLRMEQGEVYPDQQSEPRLIPPEGIENAHFFAATSPSDGDRVSVAVSQKFDVFYSLFYYGKPPEGWSLIAGDENPF